MPKKSKKVKPNKQTFTQWGNPILHKFTKPVPRSEIGKPTFKQLVKRMFKITQENGGVGLAANQIGLSMKLAVVELRLTKPTKGFEPIPPTVVINPKITTYSKNKIGGWEGCLSCCGIMFWVERSASIKVVYLNEYSKKIVRIIRGLEATIFQHEIDHLNGKVCGEQVFTKNGKVASGAIISATWYKNILG